jgi:hypothetical protein
MTNEQRAVDGMRIGRGNRSTLREPYGFLLLMCYRERTKSSWWNENWQGKPKYSERALWVFAAHVLQGKDEEQIICIFATQYCGSVHKATSSWNVLRQMIGLSIKSLEGTGRGLFEVLLRNFLEVTKITYRKQKRDNACASRDTKQASSG